MEPFIVKISSKGQLTLPAEVRKKLGLMTGSKLYLVLDNNEIRMKAFKGQLPVLNKKSSIYSLIGSFAGPEDLSENHDKYFAETVDNDENNIY
ncbi:MAG: AbrB/MazE/SpoVT family DNA-binding domain-containing protein [Bacillota bacterium]|nr:AbrB/MazE/SpoVT family DNA-binding domain-containing protein [Bacillota bacterium]